jgi:hypothetical protein
MNLFDDLECSNVPSFSWPCLYTQMIFGSSNGHRILHPCSDGPSTMLPRSIVWAWRFRSLQGLCVGNWVSEQTFLFAPSSLDHWLGFLSVCLRLSVSFFLRSANLASNAMRFVSSLDGASQLSLVLRILCLVSALTIYSIASNFFPSSY